MTPEQLSAAIRAALQSAVDAGDLSVTVPAEVRVERPRNRDHGDWSTNIALQLAKGAGIPPRELAVALATHLTGVAGVKAVDVAGPGFLNISLEAASDRSLVADDGLHPSARQYARWLERIVPVVAERLGA